MYKNCGSSIPTLEQSPGATRVFKVAIRVKRQMAPVGVAPPDPSIRVKSS